MQSKGILIRAPHQNTQTKHEDIFLFQIVALTFLE